VSGTGAPALESSAREWCLEVTLSIMSKLQRLQEGEEVGKKESVQRGEKDDGGLDLMVALLKGERFTCAC
jgi:hypothetical protein